MHNTFKKTLGIPVSALALALGLAPASKAAIKCWVNKDGVKECGTVVPPEYVQQGHEEVGKSGVTTGKQERAKTKEELEEEHRKQAEKEEQMRKEKEQAAADRVLLDTFSSEDDMIMTRDGKIANIESQIKITHNQIEKLKKNLDEIIAQAAAMERRGENPGEKVEKDIASVRDQIEKSEAFITSKRQEQEAIHKQFDVDIARFREIKTKAAAEAAAKKQ